MDGWMDRRIDRSRLQLGLGFLASQTRNDRSKPLLDVVSGRVDFVGQSLRIVDAANDTRGFSEDHGKDVADHVGDATDETTKETHLERMLVMVVRRLVDHVPLAHLATVDSSTADSIVRVKDHRLATCSARVRPQFVVSTPWRARLRLRRVLDDRTIEVDHLWIVRNPDSTTEAIAAEEVLEHGDRQAHTIRLRELDLVLVHGDILASPHRPKRYLTRLTAFEQHEFRIRWLIRRPIRHIQ